MAITPRDYEEAGRDLETFQTPMSVVTATIPVIFWVILDDDGLPAIGASLTDTDVEDVLDFLDTKFSTHPDYNFDFVNCGKINFIYNSTLQSGGLYGFDYAYNPYAVNVYIEQTPGNSISDYPWGAGYNNRIFLKYGYDLNGSKVSLTHEMGHSLGLFHTFGPEVYYQVPPNPLVTNGQSDHPYNTSSGALPRELVIRNLDPNQTYPDPNYGPPYIKGGDWVGDTPAGCRSGSPTAFPGCSFSGCNYTGSYVDYNGMLMDDPTNIIAKNLMSYSSCRQDFTNGQLFRAYTYYDNQRKLEFKPQWCGNLDDRVEYEGTDHGIDRVAIEFTQANGSIHVKTMTNPDGDFHGILNPVTPTSTTVSATVKKLGGTNPDFSFTNGEWLDGVTTFDLVKIRKHILTTPGYDDWMDGYDQIAADVNKSGAVTTFDLTLIQKLILLINPTFPAFTQPWLFIRETVTLNNPLHFDDGNDDNPFQFINLDGTDDYAIMVGKQGFDAVKLGDVNGNNSEADLAGGGSGSIVGGPIYVDIIKQVSNGQSTYEFRVQDFQNIVAYQMDIEFPEETLQLIGTQSMDLAGVNSDFFGTTTAFQGIIKTLWYDENNANAFTLSNGSGIFRLVFNGSTGQTQNDVHLSQNIGYRSSGEAPALRNFAYTPDGTVHPIIQREYHEGVVVAVAANPNPFSSSISLTVEAIKDGSITLQVFNTFGQRIHDAELALTTGSNVIEIDNLSHLPDGIYFVQLKTGSDSIVKKLVKRA